MEEKKLVQDVIPEGGQYAKDGWMFLRNKEPNLEGRIEKLSSSKIDKELKQDLESLIGKKADVAINRVHITREKVVMVVRIFAGEKEIIGYREISRVRLHQLRDMDKANLGKRFASSVRESERPILGYADRENRLARPTLAEVKKRWKN